MALESEGWVLTGGQSRRMGQDKAAVLLAGRTLLNHMLDKLARLGLAGRVAGSRVGGYAGTTFVPDERTGCGPLSGLGTALHHSNSPLVLLLGIDLPLLSCTLLESLLERARITGALATVPRVQGRPQPLCAVYRRELDPAITQLLAADTLKMMHAVQLAASATAGALRLSGHVDTFDLEMLVSAGALQLDRPPAWEFLNCNSPGDLATAEYLLQQEARLEPRSVNEAAMLLP